MPDRDASTRNVSIVNHSASVIGAMTACPNRHVDISYPPLTYASILPPDRPFLLCLC